MYPELFDYTAPDTLDQAHDTLAAAEDAKVLSGGMSLTPLLKLRFAAPALLVDIGRIPGLDAIDDHGGHAEIGAMTRHGSVAAHRTLARRATALQLAATWTGDRQVRARGTTCGTMAHGDGAADQPAAALALGATMIATSRAGTREIPAEHFFDGYLTTTLREDELLRGLRVPLCGPGEGSSYDKFGRRGDRADYAVAGVAAWLRIDDGMITSARVAVSGLVSTPSLAPGAAEVLLGSDAGPAALARAADRVADDLAVLDDRWGSREYRTHLARLYAHRALSQAVDQASRSGHAR